MEPGKRINKIPAMFIFLKRRKAIKSFAYKLPLELRRRFGDKTFYSIEQVERTLENGKYDKTFSAYAYALLCSRKDFDSYFGDLKLKSTYDSLRKLVAKKYFKGIVDFEGGAVVRFAQGVGGTSYYEKDKEIMNFVDGQY